MSGEQRARKRVLLSAYACEPNKGSEPGRGWFTALEMSRFHDVWVVTRENNRERIEAALENGSRPKGLKFIYFDFPWWVRAAKVGRFTTEIYYYAWQIALIVLVRKLDRCVNFDIVHHVTFNRYSSPSALAALEKPFVWGQVGGGETTPRAFRTSLGALGFMEDVLRNLSKWSSEVDPWVRFTARRASIAVAGTADTARRLRRIGARHVEMLPGSGIAQTDLDFLGSLPAPPIEPIRFISIGRLVAWKGFHLSLAAFGQAGRPSTEYWIVGDGPERTRLERLAQQLGCADRVRFFGEVPRSRALELLGQTSILLQPSLHDSAGWSYLEALAAGRPVICMKLGGGESQVSEESGIRIACEKPECAVKQIAKGIERFQEQPELIQTMGAAGQREVAVYFTWSAKASKLLGVYERAQKSFIYNKSGDLG